MKNTASECLVCKKVIAKSKRNDKMGIYLNPNSIKFQQAVNSEIYVDKTELIKYTNKIVNTEQRFLCVSRPRRFGKSMTANMLAAYYSKGCNSEELFSEFKIAKAESFKKHLNRYNVIHINMVDFFSRADTIEEVIANMSRRLLYELNKEFKNTVDRNDLIAVLEDVFADNRVPFIFIIDEWDCIFREHKHDEQAQKKYLDFLRYLLKDKSYIALAYMTGILPIKKYGVHSALNMFTEISMIDTREYAEFTGFTEQEVKVLCEKYNMPFEETKHWYNGYYLKGISVCNPCSVVMSMTGEYFSNFWTSTETYTALQDYIGMNFDGLRDTIVRLLAGEKQKIDTTTFTNDMVSFKIQDDVLTLLVHLGYLTFDFGTKEVSVPNYEISEQFVSTIRVMNWSEVVKAVSISHELLKATLCCDENKTAELIYQSHSESTSILKYNDENSLACIISLAYYSAREYYEIIRELPAGEEFADLVFLPRRNCEYPAMIVELKKKTSSVSVLNQIKEKHYSEGLKSYTGEILLVGISYDDDKKHTCTIEKIVKE